MSSSEQLIRAVQKATRKLASSGDFDSLLRDVLAISVQAVGATAGTIYIHEPNTGRLRFQHVLPADVASKLPYRDIPDDFGIAGEAFKSRRTIVSNARRSSASPTREFEEATGVVVTSMLSVPLMMEDEEPIGVVQILNKRSGEFTASDVAVMDTLAAVSTMAYLNSVLSEQEARASSLLGMGKVGHDIGNLAANLYANITYSELALGGLKEQLQREPVSETCRMYADSLDGMAANLKRSVDRIVGYARLIADLSAGRALRPNFKLARLSETIQASAEYLETEGRRNHVALLFQIDGGAPPLLHDELYVFRIVQNLVGNAIKAVKETIPESWQEKVRDQDDVVLGEVVIRYAYRNKKHVLEVQDSGPGMTRETAERILAGNARSNWEFSGGSGWGTKIVLELAQTHGATVSIDSRPGHGTTFRVVFPHRVRK
jgi:signal transduction histidine kinase